MGIFFGKPKKQENTAEKARNDKLDKKGELTDSEKAQLELKRTRDRLKKQSEQYQRTIEKEKEMARELINQGQKKKAIIILKRKQMQEKMLDRARGQMLNVEQMIQNVKEAEDNIKVFNALKEGNATLKSLQEQMSLDDINDIMDETNECVDVQNAISEALGQNMDSTELGEIEDEVDQMMALFAQGVDPFTHEPVEGARKAEDKSALQEQVDADYIALLPDVPQQKESVDEEQQDKQIEFA